MHAGRPDRLSGICALPTPVSAGSGSAGRRLLPPSQARHGAPPGMPPVYAPLVAPPNEKGRPRKGNGPFRRRWRPAQPLAADEKIAPFTPLGKKPPDFTCALFR